MRLQPFLQVQPLGMLPSCIVVTSLICGSLMSLSVTAAAPQDDATANSPPVNFDDDPFVEAEENQASPRPLSEDGIFSVTIHYNGKQKTYTDPVKTYQALKSAAKASSKLREFYAIFNLNGGNFGFPEIQDAREAMQQMGRLMLKAEKRG